MDRRNFLISTAGMGAGSLVAAAQTPLAGQPAAAQRTTNLKQSVTQGVFGRGMAFEDTCKLAADLGFKGYDLRRPADWPTLKKYGLGFRSAKRYSGRLRPRHGLRRHLQTGCGSGFQGV